MWNKGNRYGRNYESSHFEDDDMQAYIQDRNTQVDLVKNMSEYLANHLQRTGKCFGIVVERIQNREISGVYSMGISWLNNKKTDRQQACVYGASLPGGLHSTCILVHFYTPNNTWGKSKFLLPDLTETVFTQAQHDQYRWVSKSDSHQNHPTFQEGEKQFKILVADMAAIYDKDALGRSYNDNDTYRGLRTSANLNTQWNANKTALVANAFDWFESEILIGILYLKDYQVEVRGTNKILVGLPGINKHNQIIFESERDFNVLISFVSNDATYKEKVSDLTGEIFTKEEYEKCNFTYHDGEEAIETFTTAISKRLGL